jgi:hypothetical protein
VSALLSLLQEKIITESKISSLIFLFFQLDVLFSKWFNGVSKLTANTYKSIRRPPKRSPHYFAFMGAGGILLRWPMLVYGSVSSWSG